MRLTKRRNRFEDGYGKRKSMNAHGGSLKQGCAFIPSMKDNRSSGFVNVHALLLMSMF